MAEYFYEISVHVPEDHPDRDVVIPALESLGCHGFLEEPEGIKGYVAATVFPDKDIEQLKSGWQNVLSWPFHVVSLEDQNWNAMWERDYEPVLVDNQCLIRAPFHQPQPGVPFDIVIEPRMSFGTAHHETTHMMISLLLHEEVSGLRVLDMGSGTAVLAILAEMRGADEVWAVDNDAWAYQNAGDNLLKNNTKRIKAFLGDAAIIAGETFNLILANINRNILLQDLPKYRACLSSHGHLILSGFYEEDLPKIQASAGRIQLRMVRYLTKNRWVAANFEAS